MKLTKREMMLLFVLGTVAIVFIGVNYLVMPLYNTNKELNDTLSGLNDQLLTLQNDQRIAGTIDAQIQKEMDKTAGLSEPFAQSIRHEQVSYWLNALLKANNLALHSVEFTDIVSAAPNFDTDTSIPPAQKLILPIQNTADIASGKQQAQPSPSDAAAQNTADAAPADNAQTAAPAAPPETYCTQVILNATGSYANISKFLDALYAGGRSLTVDSLLIGDYQDGGKMLVIVIRFFGAPLPDGAEEKSYDFPVPAGQGSLMQENTAPEPTPTPTESQAP
jgi:hypothetical protein